MRKLVVIVLLLLLAGCATERYYPVYLSGGDGYYIAEREYTAASYDSLYALGMYPWWVHTYYSPYYYPNYFSYYHPFYDPYYGPYQSAGWYPSRPHHRGYHSGYAYGWPPYGSYRYRAPGHAPDGTQPGHSAPAEPVPPPVSERQRRWTSGDSLADRDLKFRGAVPQPKGSDSRSPQRMTAPSTAVRSKPPEALPRNDPTRAATRAPTRAMPAPAALQREQPLRSGPERTQRAPSERSPRDRDEP